MPENIICLHLRLLTSLQSKQTYHNLLGSYHLVVCRELHDIHDLYTGSPFPSIHCLPLHSLFFIANITKYSCCSNVK